MNTDYKLVEKGMELARLVFDVASECDTSVRSYTMDLSGFVDEIMTRLEITKVRFENPDLPEDEIQKMIDTIIAESTRRKEEIAAAKAAKRERVKQLIHSNATEGYELAYSLCNVDNSHEAKELAYRMVHHLKNHPLEERLNICRQYAESLIELGKDGNSIAKVYRDMAALVYPVNKRADYSLCLKYYEQAYEYIDASTRLLDEIIGFCNRFGLSELREKCEHKKAALQPYK